LGPSLAPCAEVWVSTEKAQEPLRAGIVEHAPQLVECTMFRLACTIVSITLVTTAAFAQGAQFDRARGLLRAGYPERALDILGLLPQTPGVLPSSVERCDHLGRAIDFGSMASAANLVEFARKRFRDEGCQLTQ
jgi:hypothetical protein